MNTTRYLILVIACALSLASAASKTETRRTTARSGITDEDLYSAAIRVLASDGHSFRTQDREAKIIITEWMSASMGNLAQNHHAWHIMIDRGELRLSIDCRSFAANMWTDCGDKRADSWVARSKTLLTQIEEEAATVSRNRTPAATAPAPAPAAPPTPPVTAPTPSPPHPSDPTP